MKRGITAWLLAGALIVSGRAVAQDDDDDDDDNQPAAAEAVEPTETDSSDGMTGNVQLLIGQIWLQDQWAPLDEPATFGVEVDFGPKKSIVHVALGFNVAFEEQTVPTPFFGVTGDVGFGIAEFSAGFLVHPVKKAQVRPYIGAGIVRTFVGVGSDWDFWSGGETDSTFGFYGNLGVFFKVGDVFNIGLDGRIVRGTEVTLAGIETDVDYEQASLLLGFSWGN
jgi:hypothetical protein